MGATQIRRRRLTAWLRRQGPTTVGAAAARFEVSERTIFRDLAGLRARGVQVEGDPGRGGGIMLRRRRKTTLVRAVTTEGADLVSASTRELVNPQPVTGTPSRRSRHGRIRGRATLARRAA